MKNSTNTEKKKGVGVLDVIIILALCACVVAGGFAFIFERETSETVAKEKDLEEYVISFRVNSMRQSSSQMFDVGDTYYCPDSNEFGVLNENLTITPAVVYVENDSGECIKTYAPENGDRTRVDVSGSFRVKGTRNSLGFFLLNGTQELVPNDSIIVRTDNLAVNICITDIEKVSS